MLLTPDAGTDATGTDELTVRVLIPPGAGGPQAVLDGWAREHADGMRQLRRDLSLRRPRTAVLEFAVAGADGPGGPLITMPDDRELARAPASGRQVAAAVARQVQASYVFPARAAAAAAAVTERLAAGAYDGLADEALADLLTSDLRAACADKHLGVRVLPPLPYLADRPEQGDQKQDAPAPAQDRGAARNYGIFRVERLDGNVGYLDLRGVADPAHGGAAIAAAMELVRGTEALLLDLRRNGGGSPHGAAFWCSYFFPGADTHLNDIVGGTGETRQYWSAAWLPGSRYTGREVYVLTSERTFSGGEDIAYNLQATGRARVVGAVTAGGAHPTWVVPVSATLGVSVPFARSVSPVTGTNWEGTGVRPDMEVPADQARDVAYASALRRLLEDPGRLPAPLAQEAREALAALPETS